MLIPSGVTVEDYNDALAKEEYTHARVTFIVDNIVFQDEELEQGGIQLSTYMNPDESMKFGIAYCTEAVIHFLRNDKTDTVNFAHEFTLEFGVEINGNIEWVTVGRFVGNKPVQDITSSIVELVAYDKMIRFDRNVDDLLARIAFPCTLSDIYDELCELVVVDKTSGDEIPDVMSRQIASADDWTFDTCREVLAAIAEANGCYAKITNDGEVKFIWFEDHTSDQTLTLDNCFDGTIIKLEKSYSKKWGFLENTKWKNVESIQYGEYDNMNNPFEYSYIHYLWKEVINEQNNRDVMQPTYNPYGNYKLWANVESYQWENVEIIKWKELETSDDVAGGIYLINNNPFLLYATDGEIKAHLQHILDRLILFHLYYVASVTMVGNWLIEPGDTVMLEVMNDTFVEYPIFNRVLKWNGACECDYETTGSL